MEFNRNHYFLVGVLLLLLGLQFRAVDSFVLNEKTTRILAGRSQQPAISLLSAAGPMPRKTVRLPNWLGYSLISVGSVLMLHALAMKKPGG